MKKHFKNIRKFDYRHNTMLILALLIAIVVSYSIFKNIFAEVETSITFETGAQFQTGNFTATELFGEENASIRLSGTPGWPLTGWQYRKSFEITNPNESELTEYQVKVTLTPDNFNYENVQSDCDDVRFTNATGTLLSHHTVNCNLSGESEFWVKTDILAASSTAQFYIYYNNPEATNGSDIAATYTYSTEKAVGFLTYQGTTATELISLVDNNTISHNGTTLELNNGEVGNFNSLDLTAPFFSKGLINIQDSSSAARGQLIPVSFAGTEFVYTSRPFGGQVYESFHMISPFGDSEVEIYRDGTLCFSNTITASAVSGTGNSCRIAGYSTYNIKSTLPIITYTFDSSLAGPFYMPLHPSSSQTKLNTGAHVYVFTSGENSATINYYRSDSSDSTSIELQMNSSSLLESLGANNSGPAIRINSNNMYDLYGYTGPSNSRGVQSLQIDELGTYFGAPSPTENISIASLYPATCTAYDESGSVVSETTLTSSNNLIYTGGFNRGFNSLFINSSWRLECDHPSMITSQHNRNSTNQSTNIWSYPQMRQFVYPTPYSSDNFDNEESGLAPVGYWESDNNDNVIDLIWNGGWGDGINNESIAFFASVDDVGANANIAFEIRTASSPENLANMSYETIGVANSGETFSATKNDLDELDISVGLAGRYVQIRAVFNSEDFISNPVLNEFTLYHIADDSAPSLNAQNIEIYESNGGDLIDEDSWTNVSTPYAVWTPGDDTQAGILGYCLYLGNDSEGDPLTTKGILGNSPINTDNYDCEFIVQNNEIDFSNAALRGDPWLSTSNESYYLNIRAIDNAGNIYGGELESYNFKFDNTAPKNPSYISLPGGFISGKLATFTWPLNGVDAPSDTNSGLLGLQYKIGNNGVWYGDSHTGSESIDDLLENDGSYQTDEQYDFPLLNEGSNFIYIRTWDNAGNVTTTTTSGVLKINSNAPSTPRNLNVNPIDNEINAYSFTWEVPETFTGSASSITYCYTVNTLPTSNTCNYTAEGITTLNADAFATQPGENTMYVVARDEALNINYETFASVKFTYSGSAPGIPMNLDVSDISIKSSQNWRLSLSWEAPINQGAGVSYYKILRSTEKTSCTQNINSFTEISTTTGTFYADAGLTQQTYYYCLRACDSANSCSAVSETRSRFPDGRFTEPAALISGPNVSAISTRKATINWVTERTSDSKVAYGLESGNYFEEEPSIAAHVTEHKITLNLLQPGTTYFYVAKWTDEDGNTGISPEKSFTTAPAPVIQDVRVQRIGLDNALINFTVTGAHSVELLYGRTLGFGGIQTLETSPVESTYSVLIEGLNDGTTYFYKINPIDSEGFAYEGTVLDFTTLPRPRVFNIDIQEVRGSAQPTMEITWQSNTPVSSIVEFNPVDNSSFVQDVVEAELLTEHTARISGLESETQYQLLVRGIDRAGNEARSDVHLFTTATDSRPPQISNVQIESTILNNQADLQSGQQKAQLIISWDTDELASSQVEFAIGTTGDYTNKTSEDPNLTYNHLVVISNLDPSQVYRLRVLSKDGAGNEGNSANMVTITPKAVDSVFEIVMNNLLQVFGFLT